jgi:amino acid transporter
VKQNMNRSSAPESVRGGRLRGTLRGRHYFTLGVGAVIGVGWAIMLGDWIGTAGPFGAMLAFVFGAAIMLPIAACYAELASVMPSAGAEVVYARALFGRNVAFAVGWFLVLMTIAITSFEAISLAWFLDKLFPGTQGSSAYKVLGNEVRVGALIIGIGVLCVLTTVHYLGANSIGRFQDVFTYLKICAIAIFLTAAFSTGSGANLTGGWQPLGGRPLLVGILWITATAPVWYGGFQVVPQAIEERASTTPVATVGRMTLMPVLVGCVFFCLVIFASSFVTPWQELPRAPLPAALAIETAFDGNLWSKLVLASIILGILATWNACILWATHLLLAMSREGLISASFARTNRFHAPGRATLFVGGVGLLGILLGRGAVVPIINMASISLSFSYVVCCWAVLRLRRLQPHVERPFRVPLGVGGICLATFAAAAMAIVSLLEPLTRSRGMPLEWKLLLVWSIVGAVFLRSASKDPARARSGD